MKKISAPLFFIFLFLISNLFFLACPLWRVSPVFALDPVIITDTKHSYPNTSGDDQNYIPSDPKEVSTIPIVKFVDISETFEPEVESAGTSGSPPVYKHQDINQIQQNLDSSELNTKFYRQNYFHFAQPVYDPLKSPETIKSTFTSYSNNNSTRRSMSAAVQRCLISNQISEISTFIDGGNSICIDREINTSKGKVRIGEIVSALINNGLGNLYYPDKKCPATQKAQNFPGDVTSALKKVYPSGYKYSLSLSEYQQLYLYGIEPVCANSLAQVVKHCDLDDQGNEVDCKEETRSEPLAAASSNQDIYRNYLPQKTGNVTTDFSKTEDSPAEADRPNTINWLAKFFKDFFSGRLSETKTFTGPQKITTKIDSRQAEGLEAHETTIKNFIPASSKKSDAPASGTNGITLDPGNNNSQLEEQFYDLSRPASWF